MQSRILGARERSSRCWASAAAVGGIMVRGDPADEDERSRGDCRWRELLHTAVEYGDGEPKRTGRVLQKLKPANVTVERRSGCRRPSSVVSRTP